MQILFFNKTIHSKSALTLLSYMAIRSFTILISFIFKYLYIKNNKKIFKNDAYSKSSFWVTTMPTQNRLFGLTIE